MNFERAHLLRKLYEIVSWLVSSAGAMLWLASGRRFPNGERWGYHTSSFIAKLGAKTGCRVWVHGVSVGEVNVALTLIEAWLREEPEANFVLTTVTREGRLLAERSALRNTALSYAPLDFAAPVRRCFGTFDVELLILVELEIWPHLIWTASDLGLPVAVVNGRLPEPDFQGYRRVRWFMQDVFGLLSLVCTQTAKDAGAFGEMGVSPGRLRITGNMKIDAANPDRRMPVIPFGDGKRIWEALKQRVVVAGGSTHPGEEEVLLEMTDDLKREFAGFLLVVAPRDISRAGQVLRSATARGHSAGRWSEVLEQGVLTDLSVLIVDTIGDLEPFYREARVAFVGKSLVSKGGQNPIEPAAAACPVIFGPFMENFAAVAESFLQQRAAIQVANAAELQAAIAHLLRHPEEASALGNAAREVVQAQVGATRRTIEQVRALLPAAVSGARRDEKT